MSLFTRLLRRSRSASRPRECLVSLVFFISITTAAMLCVLLYSNGGGRGLTLSDTDESFTADERRRPLVNDIETSALHTADTMHWNTLDTGQGTRRRSALRVHARVSSIDEYIEAIPVSEPLIHAPDIPRAESSYTPRADALLVNQEEEDESNIEIDMNLPPSNTEESISLSTVFARKLIGRDKTILLQIARAFHDVMNGEGQARNLTYFHGVMNGGGQPRNLTYFIYGGSLLGSYRHHDVIPWDDDIDVMANISEQDVILKELAKLAPKYEVFQAGPRWKLYSEHSRRRSRYPWSWPYVDISFFTENATHIWDHAPEYLHYVYEKSIVFPLHRRPLGGLSLNAPRDSYACLLRTYSERGCQTSAYSHEVERYLAKRSEQFSTSCAKLRHIYPFVFRSAVVKTNSSEGAVFSNGVKRQEGARLSGVEGRGVVETLMIGDTTLHSMIIDEPSYAITDTFELQLIPAGVL